MTKAPYIELTKVEVAQRQLETAILMYFRGNEVVSIHTLTFAAHEIFTMLSRPEGRTSLVRDYFPSITRVEMRAVIRESIFGAANFFKHSSKDRTKIYKFYYRITEIFLLDACTMALHLLAKGSIPINVYLAHYYVNHPNGLKDGPKKEDYLKNAGELNLKGKDDALNLIEILFRTNEKGA